MVINIEFYLHKARAFGFGGYWGESMKYFDHALALSKPGSSQYQEIREEKGASHHTADYFYETLESDTATNSDKGLAYVMLGQHEKGLELCSYALENNTDDDAAFTCQAAALLKLDKYEEILKIYRHYPHLIEVMTGYYGMGTSMYFTVGGIPIPPDVIAHYHLGNYDRAYEILEVTRNHSDSRIASVYELAQVGVLERQGKGDLGSIILREVMRDTQGGQSLPGFYGISGIDYNFLRGWIYFSFRDSIPSSFCFMSVMCSFI